MNRGLSRRPLFELPSDQRRFLALLGCAVRAERIRVHCFCLMTTHYHLVVESVDGALSATMQWIQSRHGGHFNRTRGRDGPLVRGRFKSIPIDSWAYLFILFRYSDLNPVAAGLCGDPLSYRFGSARLHAASPDRPKWLARNLVDCFTTTAAHAVSSRRGAYMATFHSGRGGRRNAEFVEARLRHRSRAEDDLDALLCADGAARREWIVRRAREADGTTPGLPMADTSSVLHAVRAHRRQAPGAHLRGTRGSARSLWDAAEVGLLRDVAGLAYSAMARALGVGLATVRKRYGFHLEALKDDAPYLTIVAEIARQALLGCFGPGVAELAGDLATSHLSQVGTKSV